MMNRLDQEKKNKKIGMAVSLGAHALLVLIFFFLVAWQKPDPPLPEYGIELNFGLTETGTGDIQPRSDEITREEVRQEEEAEEQIDELVEEQPSIEETEPSPMEEEEATQQPVQEEGPDVIEDEPAPEPGAVEESKPEPAPEKKVEKKEINENALYPGSSARDEKNEETSQGDNGTSGDQGVKEGDIDSRALYGQHGGGEGGPLINLSNWNWDKVRLHRDPSSENGKIVFEIKVDDRGQIIAIRTVETTVSPSVVNYYQNQVEDFTFTFNPSRPGATPAAASTGTITLFIRPQ